MSSKKQRPMLTRPKSNVKRDERGRLLPGQVLNPHGAKSYVAIREYLNQQIGYDGKEAFDTVIAVMRGEMTIRKAARAPNSGEDTSSYALVPVVEIKPTVAERQAAAELLIAYTVGRPPQHTTIDVASHSVTSQHDLSRLSMEQLKLLKEMHEVMSTPKASDEVIDTIAVSDEYTDS